MIISSTILFLIVYPILSMDNFSTKEGCKRYYIIKTHSNVTFIELAKNGLIGVRKPL
jgi:hypothetical protein